MLLNSNINLIIPIGISIGESVYRIVKKYSNLIKLKKWIKINNSKLTIFEQACLEVDYAFDKRMVTQQELCEGDNTDMSKSKRIQDVEKKIAEKVIRPLSREDWDGINKFAKVELISKEQYDNKKTHTFPRRKKSMAVPIHEKRILKYYDNEVLVDEFNTPDRFVFKRLESYRLQDFINKDLYSMLKDPEVQTIYLRSWGIEKDFEIIKMNRDYDFK